MRRVSSPSLLPLNYLVHSVGNCMMTLSTKNDLRVCLVGFSILILLIKKIKSQSKSNFLPKFYQKRQFFFQFDFHSNFSAFLPRSYPPITGYETFNRLYTFLNNFFLRIYYLFNQLDELHCNLKIKFLYRIKIEC